MNENECLIRAREKNTLNSSLAVVERDIFFIKIFSIETKVGGESSLYI
jgi:hypothetical protein